MKTGARGEPVAVAVGDGTRGLERRQRARHRRGRRASTPSPTGTTLRLTWRTVVPPHGSATASWTLRATDEAAVVRAPEDRIPLPVPDERHPRPRPLAGDRALADLEGLQLALPDAPDDVFLAAGAPWFFTLFGRDSIWAARMLLPTGAARRRRHAQRARAAAGRARSIRETGERPGGILHELRRDDEPAALAASVLPPRYYGTIDATPLWILLLHDAWRAGLDDATVRDLLPALRRGARLARGRRAAPAASSPTRTRAATGSRTRAGRTPATASSWHDGRLAEGPIALCEVQAYAHEAALAAVVLLTRVRRRRRGGPLGDVGRRDLKARFRDAFWIDDADGGRPAIALDAHGAAVDSLTSNIGHLLGTGMLDAADEARVAALLVDPRLDSGYGLRTMSTDDRGYWPLSYHCGSVWAHDTAIAVHGLLRAGYPDEARAAAPRAASPPPPRSTYRMPELYGGDPASAGAPCPIPPPAGRRPGPRPQRSSPRAALTPDSSGSTAPVGAVPASATE